MQHTVAIKFVSGLSKDSNHLIVTDGDLNLGSTKWTLDEMGMLYFHHLKAHGQHITWI